MKRDPALDNEALDEQGGDEDDETIIDIQPYKTILDVDSKETAEPTPMRQAALPEETQEGDIPSRMERGGSLVDVLKRGSSFIGNVVTSPISTLAPGLSKKTTETFLCQICYSNEPFDEKAIELSCGHRFCRDCLGNWIRTQINSGTIEHECFYQRDEPPEFKVVFKPGEKLGMKLSTFGSVLEVEEGGIADQRGVKVGFTIEKIEEVTDQDKFYEMLQYADDPAEKLQNMALGPWTAVFDGYTEDYDEVCGKAIGDDVLKELIGEEVYKKFERQKRFAANEHLRECPWPGCDHEQAGDPKNPTIKCEKCEREYCYNHSNAHPGQSCKEFEARMYDEYAQNRRAAGGKVLECPGCGRDIQKSSGCNHMTCSNCNTEFCWFCGKEIVGSVYDHYENSSCYQFRSEAFPWIEVDEDDPLGVWGWFALYCIGGLLCSGPILVVWLLGLLIYIPVFSLRFMCAVWEDGFSGLDFEDLCDDTGTAIGEFLDAAIPIACSCIFGWICFGPLLLFGCIGGCTYLIWKNFIRMPKTASYMYFDGTEIDMVDDEYKVRTIDGDELLGVWHSLDGVVEFLESRRTTEGELVVNRVKLKTKKEAGENGEDAEEEENIYIYKITLENGDVLPTVFESIEKIKKFLMERKLKSQQEDMDEAATPDNVTVETPLPDPDRLYVPRWNDYFRELEENDSEAEAEKDSAGDENSQGGAAEDDQPDGETKLQKEESNDEKLEETDTDSNVIIVVDVNAGGSITGGAHSVTHEVSSKEHISEKDCTECAGKAKESGDLELDSSKIL